MKTTSVRDFTAQVVFSFEHELPKTLADCFLRRTMSGLDGDLGLGDIEAAAEIGRRVTRLERRAR